MNYRRLYFFVFAICISLVVVEARSISPINMGLYKAANAKERYMVLYETHKYAAENNMSVDYRGIDSIEIEIPKMAPSIPLTGGCDFKGVVISVLNCSQTHTLFHLKTDLQMIDLDPVLFETGDFKKIKELRRKMFLLIIRDNNPWGETREGFDYSATRSDVLLINKGSRINSIIRTYANEHSDPRCYYAKTDKKKKVIENLTVKRLSGCTSITSCIKIENQNNVLLSNISISTPDNELYGDSAITIKNCTNITFEDVTINGTYSQKNHYGYGINMDNVWNSHFVRLKADANWGVFGSNNVSTVYLDDCDINRFDIHSYGRDVYCTDCIFRDIYNKYSSVYGMIKYDRCKFVNSTPVMTEYTYNAYVPFDLIMTDCEIFITEQKCSIMNAGYLHDQDNTRSELSHKCLPNVYVDNLKVVVSSGVKQFNIFQYYNPTGIPPVVGYLSKIVLNNIKFEYLSSPSNLSVHIVETEVETEDHLYINVSGLEVLPVPNDKIVQSLTKYIYPFSVIINFNKANKDNCSLTFTNSRLNYNTNSNSMYDIYYESCVIGMSRFSPNPTGRRTYNNCYMYLNCNDNADYYIDNNAEYISCEFIPCKSHSRINFTGTNNNVTFVDCKTSDDFLYITDELDRSEVLKHGCYLKNKFVIK